MAWEYLENLDNRYIIAADVIGELSGDVVLDVNSGNSRLGYYIKGDFKYYCNDLMDDRAQRKMSDWQFVRSYSACDVLCCFGIGGYEISGEELESATVTDSLKYAIGA